MYQSWLEEPLNPQLGLASDIGSRLCPVRSEAARLARACVIANALCAHWKGLDRVFYSRDNNHYAEVRVSAPSWYTRRNIVCAVEALVEAKLIVTRVVKPSPEAWRRSTISSTPKLWSMFQGVSDLRVHPRAPVVLRKRDTKCHIELRSLSRKKRQELEAIAEDVTAQNNLLSRTAIDIRHPSCPSPTPGFYAVGPLITDALKTGLSRIFVDSMRLGGRWYGGFWQNIPSRMRRHLTINEESTIEIDFSACQIRLAHGVLGLPDPLHGKIWPDPQHPDVYAVPRADRAVVKLALLIMINARNEESAKRALARKLLIEEKVKSNPFEETRAALRAVTTHFTQLARL